MNGAPLSPAEKTARSVALTRAEHAARVNGAEHLLPPACKESLHTETDAIPVITLRSAPIEQPASQPYEQSHPVDRWVPDGNGISRWRPIVDRVDVVELGNDERLLTLSTGFRLKLDAASSLHLALRLLPAELRTRLAAGEPR